MKRLLGLLLFVGLIAISYWWMKPHPSETAGQTVAVKHGSVSRTARAAIVCSLN